MSGVNQLAEPANLGSIFYSYHFGLNSLGQCQPARAPAQYNPETELYEDNFVPCLTEVIDWPLSVDENGYAFDQANLLGVRTRTWRTEALDGDKDDQWIAVPKTLPSGYTMQTRHASITNYIDALGGTSTATGFEGYAKTRTAAQAELRELSDPNYWKGNWGPMNRYDEGYTTTAASYTTDPEETNRDMALIASNHVGFRAGELTLNVNHGTVAGFDNSTTMKIKCRNAGTTDPFTTLGTINASYTTDGTATTEDLEYNISFSCLSPTLGRTQDFYVSCEITTRDADPFTSLPIVPPTYTTTPGALGLISFILAPRTDVPLWYFAATKNKCAPGGLVT